MRALVLAVLVLVGAPAVRADEDHLNHQPSSIAPRLVECDPKAMRPTPCHVHDPRTAKRMHPHAPALKDPHARQEFEAWRAGAFPKMY